MYDWAYVCHVCMHSWVERQIENFVKIRYRIQGWKVYVCIGHLHLFVTAVAIAHIIPSMVTVCSLTSYGFEESGLDIDVDKWHNTIMGISRQPQLRRYVKEEVTSSCTYAHLRVGAYSNTTYNYSRIQVVQCSPTQSDTRDSNDQDKTCKCIPAVWYSDRYAGCMHTKSDELSS